MPSVKIFDELQNTVFNILDASTRQGRAHFVKPRQHLPRDISLKSAGALKKVFECAVLDHHLFVGRSKKGYEQLEVDKLELPNGDWLVGFNAARFFFLPGDKPTKELKELRGLFTALRPFFEVNATQLSPVAIRVLNERDSNGRVYGRLVCIGGGHEPEGFEQSLKDLIDSSETLTLFMRNCALKLSKLGRYSWCDLREEHLFGELEQPWKQAFFKKYRAAQQSALLEPSETQDNATA